MKMYLTLRLEDQANLFLFSTTRYRATMDAPGTGTVAATADTVATYLMRLLRTSTFPFRETLTKVRHYQWSE